MLRRLFLRKSKEILNQVEAAENIIAAAQERIDKLKEADRFNLLREEILRLFYEHRNSSYYMQLQGMGNMQGLGPMGIEPDNVLIRINECLDAMEELTKQKGDEEG